eukprot:Hpha_TRINITY_DN30569_c0_g1::TRINITY_DN30569_c0_g1_i1::g.193623::m.193623
MPRSGGAETDWERNLRHRPGTRSRSAAPLRPSLWRLDNALAAPLGLGGTPGLGLGPRSDVMVLREAMERMTECVTLVQQDAQRELAAAARHLSSQQEQITDLQHQVRTLERRMLDSSYNYSSVDQSEERKRDKRRERKVQESMTKLLESVQQCEQRIALVERSSTRVADDATRAVEVEGRRRQEELQQLSEEVSRLRDEVTEQSRRSIVTRSETLRDASMVGDTTGVHGDSKAFDSRLDALGRAVSVRLQDVGSHLLEDRAEMSRMEQRIDARIVALGDDLQAVSAEWSVSLGGIRDRLDRGLRSFRAAISSLAQSVDVACPSFADPTLLNTSVQSMP